MFTKIEDANDENEQKDEAAFIFKPVSVEACRCGGGKARPSVPQAFRRNMARLSDKLCPNVHCFSCFSTYQLDFLESLRVATRRC